MPSPSRMPSTTSTVGGIFAWCCLMAALVSTTEANENTSDLVLRGPGADVRGFVEAAGLSPDVVAALSSRSIDGELAAELLTVRVVTTGAKGKAAAVPPMLGSYEIVSNRLRFTPRFPWRPSVRYRAELSLNQKPGGSASDSRSLEFEIPATRRRPPEVAAIWPSSEELPENLLKFYIHFTQPMRRGDNYRAIKLLDQSGKTIADPFLELGEELWDRPGKRFTLLLDPGRIKRGLKPHDDVGPVLEQGSTYTLVVGTAWHAATGEPLGKSHSKAFRVIAPDTAQPSLGRWKLRVPPAGTSDPLIVQLGESLDHSILQHAIDVEINETPLDGVIEIQQKETVWEFHPSEPWQVGKYRLVANSTLEDLAGNSLGRPFEVELTDPPTREVPAVNQAKSVFSRPFEIKPKPLTL